MVELTRAHEGEVQYGRAAPPAGARDAALSQQDVELNLARLARLEQELGNGGADDTVPITAGWDSRNGFHIRDAENLFLLKIGARTQIRYTYKGRDKRGGTVDAGEQGTSDESYFELERMRLQLSGHVVDPRLQYVFQWDSDTDNSGGMVLLDGLVSYDVVEDKLSIGAGQYKAHFLRQEVNSSGNLQMVERSLSNEFFNIDRVIGIYAEGSPTEQTYYSIGINNGFRSFNRSIGAGIDHIPAFVGKFDVVLLGAWEKYSEGDLKRRDAPYLSLGVSGATDANNETDGAADPQFKTYQFGLDAVFQYMGFSLFGEYVGRWLDYEPNAGATDPDIISGSNNYAHGFNVQGGVMLTESLEATARCSVVYGNEGANDGTAVEAGPGFNWFINGHKVKLQSDVMFFDIPASMPRASTNLQRSDPLDPPEFSSSAAGYDAGEQGVMWRTQFQLSF
jgi:hypothetical protein